jgi:phosphatidylinositol alpha-1,6-mannosyltransferase
MRVVLVTPAFAPEVGGIQNLLAGLVRSSVDAHYSVIAPQWPGAGAFDRDAGYDVIRVRAPFPRRGLNTAWLNVVALRHIRRLSPDVVLSGHITTSLVARASRRPWVQYVHAQELPLRPRLAALALRHATRVIAVSEHSRSLAAQFGASPDRIAVIPPGIDARAATKRQPKAGKVVSICRLNDDYKGIDVLLAAFARLRDDDADACLRAELVVIGDGPLAPALQRRAGQLGLAPPAVVFAGAVDDHERDRHLAEADVFALPARLPPERGGEGFGIVFMEATARGVPVLAGNAGGARDAVRDRETGLLVDPEDPEAVAAGIRRLMTDEELRDRIARTGPAWAQSFDWRNVAPRVESLLRQAIDAHSA